MTIYYAVHFGQVPHFDKLNRFSHQPYILPTIAATIRTSSTCSNKLQWLFTNLKVTIKITKRPQLFLCKKTLKIFPIYRANKWHILDGWDCSNLCRAHFGIAHCNCKICSFIDLALIQKSIHDAVHICKKLNMTLITPDLLARITPMTNSISSKIKGKIFYDRSAQDTILRE
jgi:hypothetical protein